MLKFAVETGSRSTRGTISRSCRSRGTTVEPCDALCGKRRIAGEQLVAAVAAERDGHGLAREPRQQVRRQDRRVGERLVEEVGDRREQVEHRLRGEDLLVVVGAEVLGDTARVPRLVEAAVAEADRERLDALAGSASAIIATTELESMPPLRKAPSGTSLTSRRRTASRRRARSASA